MDAQLSEQVSDADGSHTCAQAAASTPPVAGHVRRCVIIIAEHGAPTGALAAE